MAAQDSVKTYDAAEVILSIAGRKIEAGFDEGEFVTVEPASTSWKTKVGANGEVARAKTNNKMALVKVKLMQTSLGNNILSQLHNLDIASTNGAGVGEFLLEDPSGGMVLRAEHCWVQGLPKVGRGVEVGVYEWTVEIAALEGDIFGNEAI